MKAVILYGQPGASENRADEADTQTQVRFVGEQLASSGWQVETQALGLNLEAAAHSLRHTRPDLVFNLVEAVGGRGDLIHLGPALLGALGLAYTGCPQTALYLSSNKPLAKRLLSLAGLSTPASPRPFGPTPFVPKGVFVDPPPSLAKGALFDSPPSLAKGVSEGDVWIVKSVWEHASLGLDEGSVVPSNQVAATLARQQSRYGGEWFAERYIEGREFSLSLLEGPHGPECLPPAEIEFHTYPRGKPRIVDYAAKWDEASFEYQNTPRRFDFPAVDQVILDALKAMALGCWQLFGLRGYARVDFRVDAGGRPWILEVNANPCLSPDAGFLAAAERAALDATTIIARIVASALAITPPEFAQFTQQKAG